MKINSKKQVLISIDRYSLTMMIELGTLESMSCTMTRNRKSFSQVNFYFLIIFNAVMSLFHAALMKATSFDYSDS